mmetsp:Transcript_53691/g.160756  ORF Transcript_53691/g.160756 Transcript_53691/m.160756 type:complete len:118 (-) Transcript_53691:115-468(-)
MGRAEGEYHRERIGFAESSGGILESSCAKGQLKAVGRGPTPACVPAPARGGVAGVGMEGAPSSAVVMGGGGSTGITGGATAVIMGWVERRRGGVRHRCHYSGYMGCGSRSAPLCRSN